MRWRAAVAVLVPLAFGSLAACAGGPEDGPPARGRGGLAGSLTVLAAASLREAFGAQRAELLAAHPRLSLEESFAASSTLAAQVEEGAPADVVATADPAILQRLADQGLVERPRVLARNRLELAVAPGNPRGVRGLADLGRPELAVVLAAPQVPAGAYARRALDRAGVAVRPRSLEVDVQAALARVAEGDADVAVVYATDVRAARGRVDGVAIPEEQNVLGEYAVGVVRGSRQPRLARAFVDDLLTGAGRRHLLALGFLPP